MNTKIIKFDINKNLYNTLIAKQGDTKSRFLLFNLLDGSIPFSLENRSVRVYAVKPDRTEVFNDLIITDAAKGYCILELTTQMLAVAGTVKLELMVIEEDKKLTSSIFYMDVKESINSEKAVVSTNEFGALLTALSSLNEYDNYKKEIAAARDGEANLLTKVKKIDEQLDNNIHEINIFDLKNFCIKLKNNTKTINFIGDSISHGVGATTTFNDSWVGIMRKLLNEEFNDVNYGYVSLNCSETGHTWFNEEVIEVYKSGTWNESNPNGAVVGGYNIYSANVGDKLQVKVKKDCNFIKIYFEKNSDCGNFDIAINGVLKATINSNATDLTIGISDLIETSQYPALFDIDITVKSGRVSICGIQLINNVNDFTVNNFSKAGIALQQIHNPILWHYFNADVVFFSLGHNDCYGVNNIGQFRNYITQCIEIINNINPFVVINDFLWYEDENNEFRQELKRLSNSIKKSIYIPFPDKVPFSNQSEAMDIGFLVDFSHPSDTGHQLISEANAKTLGLSVTSKDTILKLENKLDYASVRNLVLNSANVYIGNENLIENTTVNFNYLSNISNIISQKTITFTLDVDIDIKCKDNTNFGVDTRIVFIDGTEMWLGINRNRPLEQGYEISNAWKTGKYKGQISKTFKLPNKQIASIDNSYLFVTNVNESSRAYLSNVMVSVGEKIVGWLPAIEDLENRIKALESRLS